MRRTLALALTVLAVLTAALAHARPASAAPWPYPTLQLGLVDAERGASALRASTPLGLRYHYLAGGVNTGSGWLSWSDGDGSFASGFASDSSSSGFTPVFTYYMLRQSLPGRAVFDEARADLGNLANPATMAAYYLDLRRFFQRAGARSDQPVVLHVEPDLWGYVQQHLGDNAAAAPASVSSTGLPELAGLPNNVAGFAQAIVRLRDRFAPNVVLGYHLSVWGTGKDIRGSRPSEAEVDQMAARASAFYRSLGARFDSVFAEFADRDAGYAQVVEGNRSAWWDDTDFARFARMLGGVRSQTGLPIALWQIPLGNTRMRAVNNTRGHYQDNRVQWFLDDPTRTHLQSFVGSGVVALLFGGGLSGTTCACDAVGDGVTNPTPIDGNNALSLSADDDGGFFRDRARAYYAAGALPIPGAIAAPTPIRPRAKSKKARARKHRKRRRHHRKHLRRAHQKRSLVGAKRR